jgi:hypothetical protein
MCLHAGINQQIQPGTRPLATPLPHHPAQQVLGDQLPQNKYGDLATKDFGAVNAFQIHATAKNN